MSSLDHRIAMMSILGHRRVIMSILCHEIVIMSSLDNIGIIMSSLDHRIVIMSGLGHWKVIMSSLDRKIHSESQKKVMMSVIMSIWHHLIKMSLVQCTGFPTAHYKPCLKVHNPLTTKDLETVFFIKIHVFPQSCSILPVLTSRSPDLFPNLLIFTASSHFQIVIIHIPLMNDFVLGTNPQQLYPVWITTTSPLILFIFYIDNSFSSCARSLQWSWARSDDLLHEILP